MKTTVLVDNIPSDGLEGEWGLSLHISHRGNSYLLDAGQSGLFRVNADVLGIGLNNVDCAVLSHAHYDHADGFSSFFNINADARLYVSQAAAENCRRLKFIGIKNIGIRTWRMEEHEDRIVRCNGLTRIGDGVWVLPHCTPGLAARGRKAHMYIKRGILLKADDFAHEQSLIFETSKGLAVFNSCCHAGIDITAAEVRNAFPDKRIASFTGGLHLSKCSDAFIYETAEKMRESGIGTFYTGHCTGDHAFTLLKENMGDTVQQLRTGMTIIQDD